MAREMIQVPAGDPIPEVGPGKRVVPDQMNVPFRPRGGGPETARMVDYYRVEPAPKPDHYIQGTATADHYD